MVDQTYGNGSFDLDFTIQALASMAEFMPLAVFLTDQHATVLATNHAARAIASAGDGMCAVGDRLAAASRHGTEALHAAIAAVTSDHVQEGSVVETLNLDRPSGSPPLHLLITRLFLGSGTNSGRRFACVFLGHDEEAQCPDGKWLETFFGLTRAEARVAALLSGGATLEEAASRLSIGITTARTHLSRALDKTGTRRQAGLIRAILRGPTLLNLPSSR